MVIRELDPDANQTLQVTSDKKYLWDGVEIAEERTTDGATVLKRFYSQGFVDSDGTILFYTRDHLGSIRELTDSSQTVRARYDYDPYGRMTKVAGDRDSAFTYTGHFWHASSRLNLAMFRAYDPDFGRWLSPDPIQEAGGINLYAYVAGNPINAIDPLGLCDQAGYQKCLKDAADRKQYSVNVAWEEFKAARARININDYTFSYSWDGLLTGAVGVGGFLAGISQAGGAGGGAALGLGAGFGAAATGFGAGFALGYPLGNILDQYLHAIWVLEMIRDSKISDAEIQYGKDVRKCKKKNCCT